MGMFWLELSNAKSQNNGCIDWDINNGVGCTSTPLLPPQAVDAFGNTVGSHSFMIFGGAGQIPTPEPGSLALLTTGAIGLAGLYARTRISGAPHP